MIDSSILILIAAILAAAAIIIVSLAYLRKTPSKTALTATDSLVSHTARLQAYERLILLTDRIALPNLISRLNLPGISAKDMQQLLIQNIRDEFNHNTTQQIYVSADAWTAIKNLKEQNLLIINQLGNTLPPEARSLDLNKMLLEYLMNDKKGSMHEVVSEIISFEAKKIMQ